VTREMALAVALLLLFLLTGMAPELGLLHVTCDGACLFVFSDWQSYTDHLQGAHDRLRCAGTALIQEGVVH
jgi:hypothetical protein